MTLAHLPASTRSAAEQWATAAVRDVDPEIAPVLREQLLAAIGEALPAGARTEDVQEFADRFGPVQADLAGELVRSPLVGRLAGVPYDLRRPTAERIQHAWWDPSRPEILVPRAFGIGWDLNLGALAVRLGIIEPDAEDVPFASTPASAHWIAAALPAALAVAVIAHYTAREDLPAQLPRRWDRAGRPDRWMPRRDAAAWSGPATSTPRGRPHEDPSVPVGRRSDRARRFRDASGPARRLPGPGRHRAADHAGGRCLVCVADPT